MRSAARIRRAHGDALPIRALCAHPHPSCPHPSVSHTPTLVSLLFVPRKSSFCLVAATVLLARQSLLSLNLPPPNLTRHLPPSPRNALFNCVRQIFPLSLSPPLPSLCLSILSCSYANLSHPIFRPAPSRYLLIHLIPPLPRVLTGVVMG